MEAFDWYRIVVVAVVVVVEVFVYVGIESRQVIRMDKAVAVVVVDESRQNLAYTLYADFVRTAFASVDDGGLVSIVVFV